jgi:hypothetical protein
MTLKSWLGSLAWVATLFALAWKSGEWSTPTLETGLVVIASFVLATAALTCAAVARSSWLRGRISRQRKLVMVVGSLLGLLVSLFPTVALPVMSAHPGNGDMTLRHFLLPIALLGLLLAFAALIMPSARVFNEAAHQYRAAWQAARNERGMTTTDT